LGTYSIIENRIFIPPHVLSRIAWRMCSSVHPGRMIGLMLLCSGGVFLAPVADGGASAALESRAMGLQALPRGQLAQYQGTRAGQYQNRAPNLRRLSAWNGKSAIRDLELASSIAVIVISPFSEFYSTESSVHVQSTARHRIRTPIAAQNDQTIGDSISHQKSAVSNGNPRLMLQIGAILGFVYLVFLTVWFWTTRYRAQPPRSART
jgi:hypothetical protein